MFENKMKASGTSDCLGGMQLPESFNDLVQRNVTTIFNINIQYPDPAFRSASNADISPWPAAPPFGYLVFISGSSPQIISYEGMLAY